MSWFSLFAIYFIIWWVTLFAVLPFGSRSQAEEGNVTPGTDPGAPAELRLGGRGVGFCGPPVTETDCVP